MQSSSFFLFKPLIASSLAVILSGGVLIGQDIEVNGDTSQNTINNQGIIFDDGSQSKKLTLTDANNTITSIAFKNTPNPSTNNFLILNTGKTTVTNKITVGAEKAIVFDLANDAELSLTGGIEGEGRSRIRIANGTSTNGSGNTATLSGGAISGTTIEFMGGGTQELKLQNNIANLKSVEMNINGSGDKTLTLDTTSNSVSASVSETISGNLLILNFGGKVNSNFNTASFTFQNTGSSTLKKISIANASSASDNTLTLSAGSLNVTNTISIENTKGITFNLNTAILTANVENKGAFNLDFKANNGIFSGILTTGEATTTTTLTATTNINISDNSSGTITEAVTTNTNGTTNINFVSGTNAKTLTLQGDNNVLSSITLNSGGATTNNTLVLQNGETSIAQQINITSQQGLILDLKSGVNLTLTGNLANAGSTGIKLNGTNTLTSSVTTTAGSTNISLADGASSTITSDISTSSGETTITFNGASTLTLNNGNGTITTSGGKSTIDFQSSNGVLKSKLNTQGGETEIKVAKGAKGIITNDITSSNSGANNIKYNGTSTLTLQGSTNTLISIDTSGVQGTLIIDASNNANSTTVDKAILGDKLLVNLRGTSSNKATLTFNNASNNNSTSSTIKTLTLTNSTDATQNVFSLTGGTTIVTDGVNIGNSQGLSLNLSNGANLNSNINNSSGNTEIHFNTLTGGTIGGTISTTTTLGTSDKGTKINIANGSNGTIAGNITTGENANTTIAFEANTTTQPSASQVSTLTIQGKTNQISTITVNGDSATFVLDGKNSNSGVNVEVKTAITGGKLTAKFDGDTTKSTNLTLNAGGNVLKALTLGTTSISNTLTLNNGITTITDKVLIGSGQALDFTLNSHSNLTLKNNLENSGNSKIDFSGNSTLTSAIDTKASGITNINVAGDSSGTITGNVTTESSGATNVKYASNSEDNINSLTLQGENNTLTSISFDLLSQSGKLILGDNTSGNNTTIKNNVSGDSLAGGKLIVEFNGASHASHLTLNGNANKLKKIELSGTKNTLTLTTGETTITDFVNIGENQGITFEINNANLTFTSNLFNAGNTKFTLTGNTTIDGDITTSNEPTGTTIYLSNNSTNNGTNAIFSGGISKDSQSSMGITTLQFASGTNTKKITLQGSGNTLNSIILGDTNPPSSPTSSTNNTLALTNGDTTIENEVDIQTSQALAFDLGNGTNLTLSGNLKTSGGNTDINFSGTSTLSSSINTPNGTTTLNVADSANGSVNGNISNSGTTNINFKTVTNQNTNSLSLNGEGDNQITTLAVEDGGNAQLKGKNATIETINLGNSGSSTSKLTLFNTQSTITTLTPSSSGQTTLSIDGTFNSAMVSIASTVSGSNLTLNLNGRGDSKKAGLTLQQGDNTLKVLELGENSTANTLSLTTGKTTITEQINITSNSEITFDLGASTELALTNGMDTTGTSTLQVVANGSARSATLSGGNTTATHLKLIGNASHSASITLKNPSVNLATLTTSGSAENTLTLDTSTQGVQTTISQAINGSNLKVELKGISSQTAKLSLGNTHNGTNTTSTIKALSLGDNSANRVAYNTLELKGGDTIITDALSIETNKGINFDFSGNSSLQNTLTNSGGVLALNFQNGTGTLNGSISTSNGNTSITLSDGASGVITGSVNGSGGSTTISYRSGTSAKTLTLQGGDNKITSLTLDNTNSSTHNTFNLQSGNTSVTQKLEIKNSQELTTNLSSNANLTLMGNLENSGSHTINFNGTSHTLTGEISTLSGGTTSINLTANTNATITGNTSSAGSTNVNLLNNSSLELQTKLSTTAGTTTIEFKGENGSLKGNIETTSSGTTTFNLGLQNSQSSIAMLDGTLINTDSNQIFNINAKSTTLKVGNDGLGFSSGNNTININTENSTLSWQNKNGESKYITTSGGETKIDFKNSGMIQTGISTSGGNTEVELQQNKFATISGNITTSGDGKNNLTFKGSNSALILKGSSNTLSQITSSSGSNNIISLSEGETNDKRTEDKDRRKLTIENITQDSNPLTLISQTTATQADTFIINGATTKSRNSQQPSTHSLGIVVANGVKLSDIGKSGEILVASVKNASGTTPSIVFGTTSQVVSGFTTATATFDTKLTDQNGTAQENGGYTSYFIKSMQNAQVIAAEQEITATAFTLNYDLYMANFNSLNKRMGELRENAHSQGVWARVFNGALSNDFGLSTKSNYTTIQAGYDYAFGSEGANNYLGFALSYALSTSTSEHAFDDKGQKRSIDSIYSNALELALYNSYVSDEGWYNDTIAKFSYLMSDFKINNITDPSNITSTTNDAKNFALTLSDEVGYKFALGESKEWGITPQLELGFGYFSQSDFKQTLENLSAFLQSNSDFLLTLRTRVGSSFSYDFKSFTQAKDFNASLYLGAFYEYDYVNGGEITFRTDQITQETANNLSNLQSDGRIVLNAGVNMSVKDNTRIYFDFEKSFIGKINTDYQVNFGVRYSFGESNGYTPLPTPLPQEEKKAPLKIDDSQATQVQEESQKSKE